MKVSKWERPSNYIGATWYGWFSAGFWRSRDSEALEESNFQVASEALLALSTDTPPDVEGIGQSVTVVRENHWAVGWVEWIAIHESNTAALEKARELCERANDYPILDESHWSNLEHERAMEFWNDLSFAARVDYCRDCKVSIFAARRSYDFPDRLWESLTNGI